MRFTDKKILVTGGASGIGLGLVQQFIKDGNTVIVCGRRDEALRRAAEEFPSLITRKCDLASAEEREQLFHWLATDHPDLNILVNNAGIQQHMNVTDENFFARAQEEIAINVAAPLHLTSLFVKMKSAETIMNVTSGLSFVPLVKVPVYCATKAFFHSFTLSLRRLMQEKKIRVIEIIPPALNTDLGGKGLHDFAPPVEGFIEAVFQQLDEDKDELVYGMSENVSKAGPEDQKKIFERMNAQ